MNETLIAWAAGLFEGEGCLYEVKLNGWSYLGLTIEMRDEDIIRRFDGILRPITHHRSQVTTRWRGNERHSRQYAIKMTGRAAEHAYALMRPYLGQRRRERGDEILQHRSASVDQHAISRPCEQCGEPFDLQPQGRTKRFCSKLCWGKWHRAQPGQRERALERNRRYRARRSVAGAIPGTSPHQTRIRE